MILLLIKVTSNQEYHTFFEGNTDSTSIPYLHHKYLITTWYPISEFPFSLKSLSALAQKMSYQSGPGPFSWLSLFVICQLVVKCQLTAKWKYNKSSFEFHWRSRFTKCALSFLFFSFDPKRVTCPLSPYVDLHSDWVDGGGERAGDCELEWKERNEYRVAQ